MIIKICGVEVDDQLIREAGDALNKILLGLSVTIGIGEVYIALQVTSKRLERNLIDKMGETWGEEEKQKFRQETAVIVEKMISELNEIRMRREGKRK
jgi:hypothetical protein